jgi:DNA helicase-2/ATP-dependent DNA helicase PcrA
MNTNYLDELNEGQRAAVLYNDGPSLVIAGAGSGKTRVLTYKIAYLLDNGYEPWNILALTFTNKAAREMKSRIARQVGDGKARLLWMGTFHSIFLRILRQEASLIGFSSRFTIYDTADSKSLIRSIIKEMKLDDKVYKPNSIQAIISAAKNKLVSPDDYAKSAEQYSYDTSRRIPATRDIYRHYMERCHKADAMDFDDLLYYTYILFRDHPEALHHYREQFHYILVDEYQDTNIVQHAIVQQLSAVHRMVCVVGDDAQSIYSFRGAEIDNILRFSEVYPNAKLFKLEQNYRSTQTIVGAANSLIEKNRRQIRKEVFSKKEEGEAIGVFQAYSDTEEGEIVVNKISELRRREHYDYSDFAILYRTNAQSRIFEETLRKRSIPYRIYGGLSFYQRKEIKDVIAYFRLIVNPNDEEAFKRIINYPARGIGDTTVGKLSTTAVDNDVSIWTLLQEPLAYGLQVNNGTLHKLQLFKELINEFAAKSERMNAYELGVEIIRNTGIFADVTRDKSPENLSRKENIEELVNGISTFCESRLEEGNNHISLTDYLSEVSLLTDQDEKDDGSPKVTLMTIHAAKGLEFKNVFVPGLEENLFPSPMAEDSARELEEERRLFYVAITRAEERCFLSYSRTRFRYGKMEFGVPSRFLKDIDAAYLDKPSGVRLGEQVERAATHFRSERKQTFFSSSPAPTQSLKRVTPTPTQSSGSSGATPDLPVGTKVEHERFGIGTVLAVEGTGDNAKATINFENAGEKHLLLRFAKLKRI